MPNKQFDSLYFLFNTFAVGHTLNSQSVIGAELTAVNGLTNHIKD